MYHLHNLPASITATWTRCTFSRNDPAAQILSFRKPRQWIGRQGRHRPTWLSEVDHKFREVGMGQVAAWGWLQGVQRSTIRRLMRQRATAAHAPLSDLT